ncbi:MAG: acylneuraminate cytidylyltransferase [Marmoricola sp.]|nr:acylneuraminate cytidylyltransferase [Marmoricola sp.]
MRAGARLEGGTAILTQARTGSTRLPGKVLEQVAGRTVLEHHLDRLLATGLPVVVATTSAARDDAVVDVARRCGVEVFRGSEDDVLDRFDRCASAYDVEGVVRVTSDCPLIDPAVVLDAVRTWDRDPRAYVSNGLRRTYPRGYDVEVFGAAVLHDAAREARDPVEREHVTPWLYSGGVQGLRLVGLENPTDESDLRVTLDTPEDLRLLRALLEDHDAAHLDLAGVVALLRAHPELVALNAEVQQKPLRPAAHAATGGAS